MQFFLAVRTKKRADDFDEMGEMLSTCGKNRFQINKLHRFITLNPTHDLDQKTLR